jgi:peptide chain release factor 1
MTSELDEKLGEIEARFEEVSKELSLPGVAEDSERFRTLGKSFSELGEIVRPYREYREATRAAGDARELAKAEEDPEMAAYFREEAERAESRAAGLQTRLEMLLIPTDPNDGKDLIVEIRAGTGGEEAALFASDGAGWINPYLDKRSPIRHRRRRLNSR